MKRSLLILLLLPGYFAFAQMDSTAQKKKAAFDFADSVFKKTAFIFEINEMVAPEDLQRIMLKINNAMAADKAWAADYITKYNKPGEGMPYHEKMGVTREEYEKVKRLDKIPLRIQKIRSEDMSVVRQNSRLNFKTSTDDKILEFLEFNLATKEVIFGNDTIPFAVEINMQSAAGFGKWQGYAWNFEKMDQQDNAKPDQLTGKSIAIYLGKTIPGERFFLHIKFMQVEKGQPKANMDLLGFIQ
ncbi:MAG TPA: hypothetical protein VK563_19580 [Puia sp.]|nr:hypothetical protein [Puia sp.]